MPHPQRPCTVHWTQPQVISWGLRMLEVLLAGVLLALALGVYLLFRQLRNISWQLTQLRVEHDSEQILRAIGVRPTAVPVRPEPVRQKRHLSLFIEGGAAALATIGREVRTHPVAVRTTTTLAIADTGFTVVLLAPAPRATDEKPPPPKPSVGAATSPATPAMPPAARGRPGVAFDARPITTDARRSSPRARAVEAATEKPELRDAGVGAPSATAAPGPSPSPTATTPGPAVPSEPTAGRNGCLAAGRPLPEPRVCLHAGN